MENWKLENWKNAYELACEEVGQGVLGPVELCRTIRNYRDRAEQSGVELGKVDELHLRIIRALVSLEDKTAVQIVEKILSDSDFSAA